MSAGDWRRRAAWVPRASGEAGWGQLLPTPAPPRVLEGEVRCEVAVLGAGLTGLAAARRLAELGAAAPVVLLEAQRVGDGASSASSGFVVDRATFIARMPRVERDLYLRLAGEGIRELREQVMRAGFDCQWDERGWLHVAAAEEGLRSLRFLRGWLAARQDHFEWLQGEDLAKVLGTDYYLAGIRLPGSVLVQPAALVRGLTASLPSSVALYERSAVLRLERRNGYIHLATECGSVRARRLILTTNGFSPALGFLRHRVFPLLSFGSLTRPLSAAEQELLGGEREWGVLAQETMGSTLRRTRDQRLLIRNTVHYDRRCRVPVWREREVAETHRRALAARFPRLAALPFEHSWGGVLGISIGRGPYFGELAPGIVGAAGFSGAGIAMGTSLGARLAEQVLGEDSSLLRDARSLELPPWLPPEPWLSLGARWQANRMNHQAPPEC